MVEFDKLTYENDMKKLEQLFSLLSIFFLYFQQMNQYGKQQYWDQRYTQSTTSFDWLLNFSQFKSFFNQLNINPNNQILNVGCGNAIMFQQMYDYGFHHITNIDISSVVIKQIEQRNSQRKLMKFQVMDASAMTYNEQTFDIIIDKGTIDGMMCADDYLLVTAKTINEVFRVLKTNGKYIVISYSADRKYLFERKCLDFDIKQYKIKTQKTQIYIYICTKKRAHSINDKILWKQVEQELQKQLQEQNKNLKKIQFQKQSKKIISSKNIYTTTQPIDFDLFGQFEQIQPK